jgi:DNA-directed RNA polymerase specialized sigma24 family protein
MNFSSYNDKVKFAYEYALTNAYRFESNRYYRKDLVHDVMLDLLADKDKFMEIRFLKSWVYRAMKWKTQDYRKIRYSDIVSFTNANFDIEQHKGNAIHDTYSYIDSSNILSYVRSKTFSTNNNKGNTVNIFEKALEGYKYSEIASELNVSTHAVRTSLSNTRKKIQLKYNL